MKEVHPCRIFFSLGANGGARLTMEYLDGVWSPIKGNTKARFKGDVRFTLTSLLQPEAPGSIFETKIEWVRPTLTHYEHVELAILTEIFDDDSIVA